MPTSIADRNLKEPNAKILSNLISTVQALKGIRKGYANNPILTKRLNTQCGCNGTILSTTKANNGGATRAVSLKPLPNPIDDTVFLPLSVKIVLSVAINIVIHIQWINYDRAIWHIR